MRAVRILCLLVAAMIAVSALAQEGHPITGTWSGEWGTSAKQEDRNFTTFVMSWDGKTISGIADVGPDSAPLRVATLDSTKWAVRMEFDRKNEAGKPVPFVVTATLQNPSSRVNRMIVGTFTHGTTRGDFKLKMD